MPCTPHMRALVKCRLGTPYSPTHTCCGELQVRYVLQSTHAGLVKSQVDMPGRPSLVSTRANAVAYIFVIAHSPLGLPVKVACIQVCFSPYQIVLPLVQQSVLTIHVCKVVFLRLLACLFHSRLAYTLFPFPPWLGLSFIHSTTVFMASTSHLFATAPSSILLIILKPAGSISTFYAAILVKLG